MGEQTKEEPCVYCGGDGTVILAGFTPYEVDICPKCNGTGNAKKEASNHDR